MISAAYTMYVYIYIYTPISFLGYYYHIIFYTFPDPGATKLFGICPKVAVEDHLLDWLGHLAWLFKLAVEPLVHMDWWDMLQENLTFTL